MNEITLTRDHEQCLRDQVITTEQPGPVLRDFQVLLDFLEPEGVEVGGKYNLIPLKFIGELDSRLSRPIRLKMKRPQLRSHPYLQGLNLLLRASGLSRIEKRGAKARLVLDPAMMAQWNELNPIEQYFDLLEVWLRFGRAEIVGEWGRAWDDLLSSCLQTWRDLPANGRRYDHEKPTEVYLYGISRNFYLLALMDLFGLVEVEQPPQPVTSWSPAAVRHVPFGDAVFTILMAAKFSAFLGGGGELAEQEDEEDEDEQAEGLELPQFGAWQPLFEPYFPEWRENLEFPTVEPREGEFIFRVSMHKIWRLIAMPADATLDDLVGMILRSVKFDDDHLYEFLFRNQMGAEVRVYHPEMNEGPWTDQIPIGTLPLEPGQSMDLRYDFGDNWHFTVNLERIDPPGAKAKGPRILEKHGKAPEQYPDWDS